MSQGMNEFQGKTNGAFQGKRIALLLPRFSRYGGVEQFAFRLAEGLSHLGAHVDFICARQEEEPPERVRVLPVGRFGGLRFFKNLFFYVQAERLRQKGNYDFCISLGKSWRQDLTRMGGGPLGIFWSLSEKSYPSFFQRLWKQLSRRVSLSNYLTLLMERHQFTAKSEVIAVSHLVRQWLLHAHPCLDPERVHVVYNKPDLERFVFPSDQERQQCRRRLLERFGLQALLSESPAPILLGTASTNFQLKGLAPLIQSLAFLPERCLLFVAGGRDARRYARLAEKLRLGARVHFCGRINDMPAFYQALDVFALPTYYDACSNAVLEALASGCRTISTQSNGASFFLPDEQILADPGDARAMAACINAQLERPRERFVWPDRVPAGLETFLERMALCLRAKTSGGLRPGMD